MRVTEEAGGGPCHHDVPPLHCPTSLAAALLDGFVGDFYRVTDGLTDTKRTLPQLVVVGQEGSGKSSVWEALAMLPLLPRDSASELPILLKLRRHIEIEGDSELMPHFGPIPHSIQTQKITLKLSFGDEREPWRANKNVPIPEIAPLIRKWMDDLLLQDQNDVVMDYVLEIKVQSPTVPDFNLWDLPGIVAARRGDEPIDMMQRSRSLVEKYLQVPHTFVVAVVPAFERVCNSQAFQLVQQLSLTDSTIGVLTMTDRALDGTTPDTPLAEVRSRLQGTSQDIVKLKHGYVAVKNRDTRLTPELSLEEAQAEENAWFEENMQGYIGRGLASSSVLIKKLEEMLANHARATWVPQALVKFTDERRRCTTTLEGLGPAAQDIVNDFTGVSPTTARQRMLQLVTPILPKLLECVDEEILQLSAVIHEDFLQEHELIMAPFQAKKSLSTLKHSGSLVAASMLLLDSHGTYISDHLVRILKNVVLRIVSLIKKTIGLEQKDGMVQGLDRFVNLYLFFTGVLWERLNQLIINDEDLLDHLEKSFLEFDPDNSSVLQLPSRVKRMPSETATELKHLANDLEVYMRSNGFHSTSFDEIYIPHVNPVKSPLDRETSRLIISARIPALKKPLLSGFGETAQGLGGLSFGSKSTPKGFNFFAATQPLNDDYQDVGEFETRVFFAITSHVVAPLLESICDVGDLARKMQEYVSCNPKVKASKSHIFYDNTTDTRKAVTERLQRLDAALRKLKSPSFQ